MKTLTSIFIAILVFGGIAWAARPNPENATASLPATNTGTLSVQGSNTYDFGNISMRNGKVRYEFKIKNTGTEAVTLQKIYTSCMCTTASLMKTDKRFGPYGMPGHGFTPQINELIAPNEEVTVEAVFDPAAHGPAGIGPIRRTVTLEHNGGSPVELKFSAVVTP